MRTPARAVRRIVCALACAAALASCSNDLLPRGHETQGEVLTLRYEGPGTLVQTIRVAPAEPRTGDTLRIESTVTNEGATAVDVTSRICGVDLQTGLRFEPGVRCGGFSTQGPLAPGASVRESEGGVLVSGPGTYTVRLRHLLRPEQWVTFPLVVRGR